VNKYELYGRYVAVARYQTPKENDVRGLGSYLNIEWLQSFYRFLCFIPIRGRLNPPSERSEMGDCHYHLHNGVNFTLLWSFCLN